jgi:hypothetical protein
MLSWTTLFALAGFLGLVLASPARADDVAERSYYNPYTGNTTKVAGVYNPYTGKADVAHTTTAAGGTTAARGATYNPYTGSYHGGTAATTASGTKEESKSYYNPATGQTAHVQGAYNPYTGKYAYHYNSRR